MTTACTSVFAMLGGGMVQDQLQFSGKEGSDFHECAMIDIPGFANSPEKSDSNGQVQYVGEDRIDHTPKDETLAVEIGSAFDVVAERRKTDYQDRGNSSYDLAYEVTIRNRKDTAITVEVHEPLGGDWTMLSASHRWTKTDAFAARFNVPVTAGAEATLRYRVRVTW